MSLVPDVDKRAAVDRLAHKWSDFDNDADRASYYFLALGILGGHAPDVLAFLLDRADSVLEGGS